MARIVIDRAKVESAGRKLRAIGEVLVRTVTVSMKDEPRDRDDGPPVVGGLQLLKPGRPRLGGNPDAASAQRSGVAAPAPANVGRDRPRGAGLSRSR